MIAVYQPPVLHAKPFGLQDQKMAIRMQLVSSRYSGTAMPDLAFIQAVQLKYCVCGLTAAQSML